MTHRTRGDVLRWAGWPKKGTELPENNSGDQGQLPVLGQIHDTNLHGRFELLLYADGILAVKGNYVRTALLAGGAVLGGAGGAAAVGGVAAATRRGRFTRDKRTELPSPSRAQLLSGHPTNHFIPRAELAGIALKKRWYSHSITVTTTAGAPEPRKYTWKPALNHYQLVRQTLLNIYGPELVSCDP